MTTSYGHTKCVTQGQGRIYDAPLIVRDMAVAVVSRETTLFPINVKPIPFYIVDVDRVIVELHQSLI